MCVECGILIDCKFRRHAVVVYFENEKDAEATAVAFGMMMAGIDPAEEEFPPIPKPRAISLGLPK